MGGGIDKITLFLIGAERWDDDGCHGTLRPADPCHYTSEKRIQGKYETFNTNFYRSGNLFDCRIEKAFKKKLIYFSEFFAALETYPIPTNFAFCGLIAGSLPFIFKKVKGHAVTVGKIIPFLVFFGIVILMAVMGEK